MTGTKRTFKYVYIPCDITEPVEELEMDYIEGENDIECLLNK